MAIPLARSQFFFFHNAAIRAATKSCGSKFLSLAKPAPKSFSVASALIKPSRIPSSSLGSNAFSGSANRFGLASANKFGSNQTARAFSTFSSRRSSATNSAEMEKLTEEFAKTMQNSNYVKTNKRRPVNTWKPVGYWLIFTSSLVFGIVVLGGLTRLTESGLSITEWKPVTGSIPPLSQAEWEEEFEKYKSSPEFKLLNSNITLSEFKFIFFMEWSHRLVGRAIGMFVLLPAAYFIYTRKTTPHVTGKIVLITALLGLQGFIGWWMVKSGLDNKFLEEPGSHPRVSQYRLATHLFAAFLLYTAMMFTGIDIIREAEWIKNPTAAVKEIAKLDSPALRRYRSIGKFVFAFVFFTAMTGAFVAGLDAGMIYNSFPYMGETIVPPKEELFNPDYNKKSPDSSWSLFWRNMLENPTTVQFNHRVCATTAFFLVLGYHVYSLRMKHHIPRSAFRANFAMMGLASLQVCLGISTLIYVVPTPLAAAHQAGALALLTSLIFLCARLKQPRTAQRLLISALERKASKEAANKASKVFIKPQKPLSL